MQHTIPRRVFMGRMAAAAAPLMFHARATAAEEPPRRKMTIDLVCGAIGVNASQREAIDLASRHGFESVAPDAGFVADLSETKLDALQAELKAKNLVFGAAGLSVDFRRDEATFVEGMRDLPRLAAALGRAGVTRVGTWLRPAHDSLTYLANFKQHTRRLREIAEVLGERGLRFGLEYVGPKTSWSASRHPFVHSLAEAQELIEAVGRGNVGLVLDSWHWYTARETVDELLTLTNQHVVAVDLNDAPAGIDVDRQIDSRRELPCATGVIDLKGFLGALVGIGYDGPVRAEPFNAALRQLPADEDVAATAEAMRLAFQLI